MKEKATDVSNALALRLFLLAIFVPDVYRYNGQNELDLDN